MPTQGTQTEPTMEEILASIRRIISEDGSEKKPQAAEPMAAAPATEPEPAPVAAPEHEDVLELTEMLQEPAPEPVIEAVHAPEPVVMAAPQPEPVRAPEPIRPQPVAVAPRPVVKAPEPEGDLMLVDRESKEGGLLSESTLDRLTMSMTELERDVNITTDGRSLEEIVKDVLRPLLKNWLEDHLSEIVDRNVKAELERLRQRRRS